MKRLLIHIFLVLGVVACGKPHTQNSTVTQGTIDGGGGNLLFSTQEQVRRELKDLKINFRQFFSNFSSSKRLDTTATYNVSVADPEVLKILKEMEKEKSPLPPLPSDDTPDFQYGQRSTLIINLLKTEIVMKEDGPCVHGNNIPSPASTKFAIQSPICFSIQELQKTSPSGLRDQLFALLMHELAHQYGADENTAIKIQKMMQIRASLIPTLVSANITRMAISNLKNSSEQAKFYSGVAVGNAGQLAIGIKNDYLITRHLSKELLKNAIYPENEIQDALRKIHKGTANSDELEKIPVVNMINTLGLLWGLASGKNFNEHELNLILDGYATILHNLILKVFAEHDSNL